MAFEGVKQLLETVVPGYFKAFKFRFDKTTRKIVPLLDGQFKHLLHLENMILSTPERISRIESILTLKIGHLNSIRDLVKRHKSLYGEIKARLKD